MLSNTGTCTYNGVTWTALYKSRITSKPIRDEANRTTVYVEHTLEVDGYIAEQTTDDTMEDMRIKLTAQGGDLRYLDKGFGDLNVNGGGSKDSAWGPIPELLEWYPIGNANAAKVKWRVTCRVPECDNASFVGKPLAVNYEVDYMIDRNGLTTVRTSGYIEIPMTRTAQGNRNPPDSADKYRASIVPAVPVGFRREQSDFHLSKDKRRLDFNFEDKQLEQGMPLGVTDIDADETISSGTGKPGVFRMWTVQIDASMTVDMSKPKTLALTVFMLLLKSRLEPFKAAGKVPLPLSIKFKDSIFTRKASFSVSVWVVGFTPQEILNASGMWSGVPGSNWQQWSTSIAAHSPSGRGHANLTHAATDDAIIDLCIGGNATLKPGTPGTTTLTGTGPPVPQNQLQASPLPFVTPLTPNNSWLHTDPNLQIREGKRMSVMKPLPTQPILEGSAVLNAYTDLASAQQAVGNPLSFSTTPNAPPDAVQRPVAPDRSVVLYGTSARIGYRAPPPALLSFAGGEVVETERKVSESTPAGVGGVPIFVTRYEITYIIPGEAPSGGSYLPSPGTGITGGSGGSSTLTSVGQ